MSEVAVIQPRGGRSLTAVDMREQVNLVQEVMKAVMKPDVHYGIIPGCKQPSLYKAGSEVLLATFRIAVKPVVEDLSTDDCVRYRVRVIGVHQSSDIVVGEGIGECSSNEEKYKWRKVYNKKEFESTPESRRRIRYTKYGEDMQVRTEPADVANTVLKMAKKRAQIDMTLTATAASDCFAQDLEDLPDEVREQFMDDQRAQARPGVQAAKRTEPEPSAERDALIAKMQSVAKQGSEALRAEWERAGKESRALIGDKLPELKAIAAAIDEAARAVPEQAEPVKNEPV